MGLQKSGSGKPERIRIRNKCISLAFTTKENLDIQYSKINLTVSKTITAN
jgi:hypothetical protein